MTRWLFISSIARAVIALASQFIAAAATTAPLPAQRPFPSTVPSPVTTVLVPTEALSPATTVLVSTAALSPATTTRLSTAGSLTVQDDTGRTVTLHSIPARIVSLAPGATEMLFAAGAGQRVIATVEYSDEPAAAKQVPRIGDVVAIDMEKLVALRPEVAVVWPGGGNPAQIEEIGRIGIPIYRQQVNTLADLPGSLRRLGALAGTQEVPNRRHGT